MAFSGSSFCEAKVFAGLFSFRPTPTILIDFRGWCGVRGHIFPNAVVPVDAVAVKRILFIPRPMWNAKKYRPISPLATFDLRRSTHNFMGKQNSICWALFPARGTKNCCSNYAEIAMTHRKNFKWMEGICLLCTTCYYHNTQFKPF